MSTISSTILSLFKQQQGYARHSDLLRAGLHHQYLQELVQEGKVVKLHRGLYRLASIQPEDELEDVSRIMPRGIVCLFSAWNYYELTDFVPPEYHLAIEKSRTVSLPDYPPIKLYYWSEKYWKIGQTTVRLGQTYIPIYTLEKSVCDAVRFRNKVGKEVEKEIVANYLSRPDRNIELLLDYARQLRIGKRMKEYLSMSL